MISKESLVYDPIEGAGDVVGAVVKSADGTQITHTDNAGKKALDVNVANDINVTADISPASLTDLQTIQDTSNTILTQIETNTQGLATETKQDAIISELNAAELILTQIETNTQDLATEAKQDIIISELNQSEAILTQIETNTQGLATALKQDDIITELQNINNAQIVLNIKEQIMRATDRQQDITYADFGTKNQRITEINYSAVSVGVQTAKKLITYTLVGNKYRRDSIDWSIV
jgi:hypothetical protein